MTVSMHGCGWNFFLTQERSQNICMLLLFNKYQRLLLLVIFQLLLQHLNEQLIPLHFVHCCHIMEALSHIRTCSSQHSKNKKTHDFLDILQLISESASTKIFNRE